MKTDSDKEYNVRDMDQTYGVCDGWLGCRKNGSLFLKRFRKGASVFGGGVKLDDALRKHPKFKAVEVKP